MTTSFNNPYNKVDYIFKFILIGGQGVGKSSLLNRFMDNSYTENYVSTIGVDFRIKTVKIEDKVIKLQIWDTAGQERFGALTSSHFKGAHGCVCVYDISNSKSFDIADKYLEQAVISYNIPGENVIVVGNKADLEEQRQVNKENGIALATKYRTSFMESSAKINKNVENIFLSLAKHLAENMIEQTKVQQPSTATNGGTGNEGQHTPGQQQSPEKGTKSFNLQNTDTIQFDKFQEDPDNKNGQQQFQTKSGGCC